MTAQRGSVFIPIAERIWQVAGGDNPRAERLASQALLARPPTAAIPFRHLGPSRCECVARERPAANAERSPHSRRSGNPATGAISPQRSPSPIGRGTASRTPPVLVRRASLAQGPELVEGLVRVEAPASMQSALRDPLLSTLRVTHSAATTTLNPKLW